MEEKRKLFIDTSLKSIRPGISQDEVQQIFVEWAPSYEEEVLSVGTYIQAVNEVVQQFSQIFPDDKTLKILDIGAGTGLIGQLLQKNGFSNIDALDATPNMLNEAKKKQVYQNLICDVLGENRLNIEDDTYDAIIGSGIFLEGHANQTCFPELIRITKPGGTICLVMGEEWLKMGVLRELETDMERLVDEGKWILMKRAMVPVPLTPLTNGIQFILKVN